MDTPGTTGTRGEEMMSPMEVATYLGIGRTMVYTILSADTNRLRSYKIGKRRVIRRRDVEAWLRSQEYDPVNDLDRYCT